jgi:hypothetical protein
MSKDLVGGGMIEKDRKFANRALNPSFETR